VFISNPDVAKEERTMKRHVFRLSAVLAAVIFLGTGRVMAITWGEPDGKRHPNVAAIVVETDWPGWGTFQAATGTLVGDENGEKFILTAGHTIVWLRGMFISGFITSMDQIHVSFDPDNCRDPKSWVAISDLVIDPLYYEGNGGADDKHVDLGAVILAKPCSKVPVAILPRAGLLDDLKDLGLLQADPEGTKFTVVGYGTRLDFPPPERVWDTVDRRFAYSGFLGLNDSWLHLLQNQATGNGGTGSGDSGGPTFLIDPATGEETLVAVTSWGDPNLVASSFSYRVDTERSLAFIAAVIGGYRN
jgi:hypothetical protein